MKAIQDQIQSLKDLVLQAEYRKAIQAAEKLLSNECELHEKHEILLQKAQCLTWVGNVNEASHILNQLENENLIKKNKRSWFICKFMMSYVKGSFKDGWVLLDQMKTFFSTIQEKNRQDEEFLVDMIIARGVLCASEKKLKDAFMHYSESLELSEKIGYQKGIADSYHGFMMYFELKGESNTSYQYGIRALELRKKLGDKGGVAATSIIMGIVMWSLNRYSEALEFFLKGLSLAKEIEAHWVILLAQNNFAEFHIFRGNLDEAMALFKNNARIYEKTEDNWMSGGTLQGIAHIYYYKGQIEKAIETFQKSNSKYKMVPYEHGINENNWKIASIYAYRGDFAASEKYYLGIEKFYQDYKNPVLLARVYFDLITLYVNNQEMSKAKEVFNKLVKINDQTDVPNIEIFTKYCEALLLKSSKKFHDIGRSQELLRDALKADIFDFESKFAVMLTLCELLLVELEFSSDDEILVEITELINKMEEIARTANSQILLINILTLKGKFALLTDGSKRALEILDQALKISQKKGLEKSTTDVTQEIERIQKNIDKWLDTLSKNIPIGEKLGPLKLKEYLRDTIQIVHTKKWTYEPVHTQKCTVFISYAVADSNKYDVPKIAKALESKLKVNKVYCWELWDGFPDGSIIKFMETGIRDSQFFLPVFTKSYNDSINCQKEYEAALAVNKTLIPIFTEIEQVPVLCRAKMGVDASKIDHDAIIEQLFKFIEAELQ